MPRKSIIDSVQNEEAAANSPVRRSSRTNNGGTANAETEKVALTKDSGIPTRTLRPRRASTQSVDDREDIKPEEKSAPARRGRKSSVTSESSEVSEIGKPKSVRGRRTSKTEETETAVAESVKEEPKAGSRVTNKRRTSFTDNLTQETASPARRTTRSRRASNSEDVLEEASKNDAKKDDSRLVTKAEETAKPVPRRSRRLSTEAASTPKTTAKITKTSSNIQDSAINSTDMESLKKVEDDSENSSEADLASVDLKEMSIKITPLKKRKILDNVEVDFNLSVIDESTDHLENSQTEVKQESIDKKDNNEANPNLKADDSKNNSIANVTDDNNETKAEKNLTQQEAQVNSPRKHASQINITPSSSPRRSPRLEGRLSSNQSPKSPGNVETVALNTSTGSTDSNKENVQNIAKQKSDILRKGSLGRVSNVFKPNQRECSFQEPMEVSFMESTETVSLDNSSVELNKTESNTVGCPSNERGEDSLNKEDSNASVRGSDSTSQTKGKETSDEKISVESSSPLVKPIETHVNENEQESKNLTARILSALKRKSSSPIHGKLRKSKSPSPTEISKNQEEPCSPQSSKSPSKSLSPIIGKRASSSSSNVEVEHNDTKLQTSEEVVENKSRTPVKTVEVSLVTPSVNTSETNPLEASSEQNDKSLSSKETNAEDKIEGENTKVDGNEPIITSAPTSPKDASIDFEFNLPSDNDDDFLNSQEDDKIASTINESANKTTHEKSIQSSRTESVSVEDSRVESVESEEDNEVKAKNKNEGCSDTQSIKTDNTFSEISLVNNYTGSTRDDKSVNESSIGENATQEDDESKLKDTHVIVDLPDEVEKNSDIEAVADMHKEIVEKYLEEQAKTTLDNIEIDEESKNDTNNHSTENSSQTSTKSENRLIETQLKTPVDDSKKTVIKKCNATIGEPVAKEETVKSSPAGPEKKKEKAEKPRRKRIKPIPKDSSTSDGGTVEDEEDVSEEEYNQFVDDMAEEGEEDTPSEDSNQIPEEGESVGSSNLSVRDTSDDYDLNDSFICNDELSEGSELGSEDEQPKQSRLIDLSTIHSDDDDNAIIKIPKKQKREKPSASRIISIIDSSSDEEQKVEKMDSIKEKVNNQQGAITIEDDTLEKTALNKPKKKQTLNISITAGAEKDITQSEVNEVKDDARCLETVDNESDVEIVDVNSLESVEKESDVEPVKIKSPKHEEVELSKVQSQVVERSPKYRTSSFSVHENVKIDPSLQGNLTKRISSLVDSFCSTVTTGEISMNLSLEVADRPLERQSSSPDKESASSNTITILSDIKISQNAITIEDQKVESVSEPITEKEGETLGVQEKATKKKKLKRQLSKSLVEENAEPKEKRKRKKGKKVISEGVDDLSEKASPTKTPEKSVKTDDTLIEEAKNKGIKRRLSKSLTEISDEPEAKKKPRKEKKSASEENLSTQTIDKAPKFKNKAKKMKPDRKQKAVKSPEVITMRPDRTQLPMESFNLMQQLLANNRPRYVIKPTRSSINDPAWTSSKAVNQKPSLSQVVVKGVEKLHPKDFKNIMLSDNNRIKRIDTKTLLRKKAAF